MILKLIIERLKATINMLKSLKSEEFNYNSYVTDHSDEGCGTVCCVAGWYPKYFPESGLVWGWNWNKQKLSIECRTFDLGIPEGLVEYHGIPGRLVRYLFYGMMSPLTDMITAGEIILRPDQIPPNANPKNNLSQVIQQFEFILSCYEEGRIKP